MATQQKTLQGTGVMPGLTVNNLQQSLDFFDALGFEVVEPSGFLMTIGSRTSK